MTKNLDRSAVESEGESLRQRDLIDAEADGEERILTDGESQGQRQLETLTADEQQELIIELTSYAAALIRWYANRFPRGVPPGGVDAGDLAFMAIERLLDGRRRPWDSTKEPSLLAYLKSVVKSIFTSEILPAAEREAPTLDANGEDIIEKLPAAASNPGEENEEEIVERRKEELLSLFETDEDKLVLMCMMDETTKAADIADELGLKREDVYRIKRKIKRRLAGLENGE